MSKSATKTLRGGIGREKKRRIPTILFAHSGVIRAFVADLDNGRANGAETACDGRRTGGPGTAGGGQAQDDRANGTRNGRRRAGETGTAAGQTPRNSIMAGSSRRACTSPAS